MLNGIHLRHGTRDNTDGTVIRLETKTGNENFNQLQSSQT